MSTLVVYFSRKGYVRRVAEELAAAEGAEIYAIKARERTAGILGFWWCGRFAMHRRGMPIEPCTAALESYDKVILCSPVWVFSAASPTWEFVRQAAGRIRAVDYVLVHFSSPLRYTKTIAKLDAALGITHGSFTSIVCRWGRLLRRRAF